MVKAAIGALVQNSDTVPLNAGYGQHINVNFKSFSDFYIKKRLYGLSNLASRIALPPQYLS